MQSRIILGVVAVIAIVAVVGIRLKNDESRAECIRRMNGLAEVKRQYRRTVKKSPEYIPTAEELEAFHKEPLEMECPKGGRYWIGPLRGNPRCPHESEGHILPEAKEP